MVLLSVVVPTFNEATHIEEFLRDLTGALTGVDYEILVVDDNSPDGTHAKVAALAQASPRIIPILRTHEKGLATAVIHGMRSARGTYVVVMDSDYQHPPPTVPRLLEAAQTHEADLVVASRYAGGGSVTGFPPLRRLISWGAKTLAYVGLPAVRRFKVRDPMSGFFLARRDRVPLEDLKPRGYKILLEVLARADLRRVTEVGFAFASRRAGESKLRLKTQKDYFLHVLGLALRDRENHRVALFALVGTTGIFVHLAVLAFLFERAELGERWFYAAAGQAIDLGVLLAGALAREAGILWNFVWNDLITFRDKRHTAHAGYLHRALRFHLVSLWAFLVYLIVFYPLYHVGLNYLLAATVAIFAGFAVNYLGNLRWTYAKREETRHA